MVTLFITSLVILGLLAVVVYFWQKPTNSTETEFLPTHPSSRGLFAPDDAEIEPKTESSRTLPDDQRVEILSRAHAGSNSALKDADASGDAAFYEEVLTSLVAVSEGPKLLSLVSFVSRNNLTVNTRLAEECLAAWKNAPTRNSTAEMLHVAALANDARMYETAVEATLRRWREGALGDVSAEELKSLIDGEFWILSSNERSSGAGFLLKRTLANARRELDSEIGQNS